MKNFIARNKEIILKIISDGIIAVYDFWIGAWKEVLRMCILFLAYFAIPLMYSIYPESEIIKKLVVNEVYSVEMNSDVVYILFQCFINLYALVAGLFYLVRDVFRMNKNGVYKCGECIFGIVILQMYLIWYQDSILDMLVVILISYALNYFVAVIAFKINKFPSRNIGDNCVVTFSYVVPKEEKSTGTHKCFFRKYVYDYKTNMRELMRLYHDVNLKKDSEDKDSQEK